MCLSRDIKWTCCTLILKVTALLTGGKPVLPISTLWSSLFFPLGLLVLFLCWRLFKWALGNVKNHIVLSVVELCSVTWIFWPWRSVVIIHIVQFIGRYYMIFYGWSGHLSFYFMIEDWLGEWTEMLKILWSHNAQQSWSRGLLNFSRCHNILLNSLNTDCVEFKQLHLWLM